VPPEDLTFLYGAIKDLRTDEGSDEQLRDRASIFLHTWHRLRYPLLINPGKDQNDSVEAGKE
ncbi:MAG: hypothetical protein EZS28_050601, partial [Streblomastix strix]